MRCPHDRRIMVKKSSFERRRDLYRDSLCIEEYCVKRDFAMPSFRWKLFDVIVFWHKHRKVFEWISDTSNLSVLIFSVPGLIVGSIFRIVSAFVNCSIDTQRIIQLCTSIVSSILFILLAIKIMDIDFRLSVIADNKQSE